MARNVKSTYVLGTGLSHDGSACLIKDGRICVAIEKERITRRKHDGGNDSDAVSYCLQAEGITIDDVAVVVQNDNFGMLVGADDWFQGPRVVKGTNVPLVTISHHLAHAFSAICASPFDEASVLIIDGSGNSFDDCLDREGCTLGVTPAKELEHLYFEKDSYYHYEQGRMRPVYKDFSEAGMGIKQYPMRPNFTMHSIGGMYLAASVYVFAGFEDPGKLMGLAPFGRPNQHDFPIFDLKDGRVFVRYDWMERFTRPARNKTDFKEGFQAHADFAWWLQREVERALLYVVNHRYEQAPSDNLVYAGGVALNAVANRVIRTQSRFKNMFIQPAAGDNGLAVGCAYYGWQEVLKRERVKATGSSAFGRHYRRDEVDAALKNHDDLLKEEPAQDVYRRTAELLADGKVVGWFQGGSELGPRALGHRSILADPRLPEMRDFINSKVKFREDFRPFAPSVLREDCSTYFDCDYESPYMVMVAPVRPEWRSRIPSVVHQDFSARIQTVTEDVSPAYYRLLKQFKEVTGISVLLNTSFNRKGMPIVETPEEAIRFFLSCALDALVLEDRIFFKVATRTSVDLPLDKLLLERIKPALERNVEEAKRIGGVFELRLSGVRTFTMDLSRQQPTLFEGRQKTPDVVLELSESDFQRLYNDPNEAQSLFGQGKISVNGDPARALQVARILRMS
ncbi:SCP2 sterol-binding domain-containing protein [Myxococcus sp. CA051A]|uniref:Transferase n=1 Tax=Myxococcus llanfairpwllgwyngyllgogerychwyrndrobwllllantysiliogogogochensis TaxID=2590453 RepID=A0A540X8V2_9BACT|nr:MULTISPECIES: carbamoyltransferase C-terminal domain-containing protein [Myxococcus]NTX13830.1 SCP2 sterol-binding domain-containing protein [Myxococcus sp. CA056]NTX62445.1 SCP2 sterol-binding domain-containing protein [Myxococcus sp. CA051A]TQF17733.1 transferase [Myxococcus llanfairpwllgwyngyllgogerychwyrndrobwllllantysiliogogogochensis]